MKRVEYFFEKTLPGQFIGTLGAMALPFLFLIILEAMKYG